MTVKITRLSNRESRTVREIDRAIARWRAVTPARNSDDGWDHCVMAMRDLQLIRDELLEKCTCDDEYNGECEDDEE